MMGKTSGIDEERNGRSGLGIDHFDNPVIDPTANVIALTDAANRRQDDLRELNDRLLAAHVLRLDAAIDNLKEVGELRASHAREMANAESNRLNSIRQVDVLAVSTAADRAQAAIQALAAVTTQNAENLRNALSATAATIAQQTAGTVNAITERLSALEKSSYEGKGKQAVSDPQIAELVIEMKSLRESRSSVSGKSEGISSTWGIVIVVVTMLIGMGGLFLAVRSTVPAVAYSSPPVVERIK